ncbi:E3 ubiquitin-protein ligase MARCHF5 [Drosophila ficusphila]|uniref:E3 ubiquitin-protein ligase MARCHF5 n=1 Tax=Drosophila ficusphila TaxID=30025 RepID=UPI0007E5FC85|nr:E3 ubiquitin-protein ligase MARCHF5 [Drosophila ficusphila]
MQRRTRSTQLDLPPLRNRRRNRIRSGWEPQLAEPEEEEERRMDDRMVEERMCWICLTGDEEQPRRDWLHPCRCRGSGQWVHEACLSRWIDEKQILAPDGPVSCAQCRTEYIIVMPPLCRFDALLVRLEKCYERLCPSVLLGILAATVYFWAVTYGALTLLELAGYQAGMKLLDEDPTLLMILLPLVPTALLLGRMVRWDDCLVRWLRRHHRLAIPEEQRDSQGEPLPGAPLDDEYFDAQSDSEIQLIGSPLGVEQLGRAASSFCVALGLPTVALILGRTLYGRIYGESKPLGILLGGVTFVAAKGLACVYLRHSQYHRKRLRFVKDYVAPSTRN